MITILIQPGTKKITNWSRLLMLLRDEYPDGEIEPYHDNIFKDGWLCITLRELAPDQQFFSRLGEQALISSWIWT